MSRWLLTGAGGMLGRDVQTAMSGRADIEVTALERAALDITDRALVTDAVAGHDVVSNCAAWTDVDGAEAQEAQAFAVNAVGAAHLARAASVAGARLLHVSTDYGFGGDVETTP